MEAVSFPSLHKSALVKAALFMQKGTAVFTKYTQPLVGFPMSWTV